ncbi:hypothetical protein FDECE_11892 [Fusarium decemcellulare]|nr:hypothetical protein FDECE_11892 [Fusarium decemcellulare]
MGKLSFDLPPVKGSGDSGPKDRKNISDYDKFPFDGFHEKKPDGPLPPLLDKSSAEYRERALKTLNALQSAYQNAFAEYEDTKRSVFESSETIAQISWNMAVLDVGSVHTKIKSPEPMHPQLLDAHERAHSDYRRLASSRKEALGRQRNVLFSIESAVRAGMLELERLDKSDKFFLLRNNWMKLRGQLVDGQDLSSNESTNTIDD